MAVRRSIRGLSPDEMEQLRQAFARSQALPDDRGYNFFAGIHGLPLPTWCLHGSTLFLPWHRAYLYFFELSLQDLVPDVGIPWWDWTSNISHVQGIPPSYSASQAGGRPNPLLATTMTTERELLQFVRQQLPGTLTPRGQTLRDPDVPDELPRRATIEDILAAPTFEDFSGRLENVHNDVHVWVSGAMSQVPTAAFDPIFWSHHTMIDRLWSLWQARHPGLDPPNTIINTVLAPFRMTVAQTSNIADLGYEYGIRVVP